MYGKGQGVPQDYAEAVRWYRKATDQGNADAEGNLGVMYDEGQGVPQDYAEAVRWCRKAADQGNAGAQSNLGRMYYYGRGVPPDYAEAYMWANLAASRAGGDDQKKFADARELVAKKMTAEQIAEAQRRAREWKPESGGNKGGKPVK
jgi:TPR repeat protein